MGTPRHEKWHFGLLNSRQKQLRHSVRPPPTFPYEEGPPAMFDEKWITKEDGAVPFHDDVFIGHG